MAERAALRQMEMAELERETRVSTVGLPAIEGLTAFEVVAAQPGWVSPRDEFGNPRPNWTEIQLAEGARRQAEEEAAAKAAAAERLKKALQ